MEPRPESLVIAVPTYRRPEGLARLLKRLREIRIPEGAPSIRILVVDNDPDGSARMPCRQLARDLPWPLDYTQEPRRGIAPARNRALDEAGEARWLCFIDDDERPEPVWLQELLRVQQEYRADAVGGPVIPRLPAGCPGWIEQGQFFHQTRHETGRSLPYVYTNNVLLDLARVRTLGLRFDKRWALVGCEDRAFFQRWGLAGARIVWADRAEVIEEIPPSRARPGWILQRAFRYGDAHSLIELDLHPGLRTRLRLAATGLYRIAKGLLLLPFTWPLGRHMPVRYLRHIYYGAGILAGWTGYRYQEYRTTHGS